MRYNLSYPPELADRLKQNASGYRIILASNSPRRAEIMNLLGIEFVKVIPDVDENISHNGHPGGYAERLAKLKAEAVSETDSAMIIAADTIVVRGGEIINKPVDEADAACMLKSLSGQEHQVITAVALRNLENGRIVCGHAVSHVQFKRLSEKNIEDYITSGEPFGKAGAYAIQGKGGELVESYRGELDNIVGFPAKLFGDLMEEMKSEV
jgi:septum formation protein